MTLKKYIYNIFPKIFLNGIICMIMSMLTDNIKSIMAIKLTQKCNKHKSYSTKKKKKKCNDC